MSIANYFQPVYERTLVWTGVFCECYGIGPQIERVMHLIERQTRERSVAFVDFAKMAVSC